MYILTNIHINKQFAERFRQRTVPFSKRNFLNKPKRSDKNTEQKKKDSYNTGPYLYCKNNSFANIGSSVGLDLLDHVQGPSVTEDTVLTYLLSSYKLAAICLHPPSALQNIFVEEIRHL